MMFTRRMFPLVILAAAMGLSGLHAPAAGGGADSGAAAAKTAALRGKATAEKLVGKGAEKATEKGAEKSEERPACMHCGATCGLVAVCVCKPGTKKNSKTEYEATSDPICVPCCGGPPWKPQRRAVGCTACEAECHDAWVRQRKKLVVEKKDEEQPTIERQVAWVCRGCGSDRPVSCTGCGAAAPRRAGWWPSWLPHP